MEQFSGGQEQRHLLNSSAVILQNTTDKQWVTSVESLWKGATNHERSRTTNLNSIKSQLHYFQATYYSSSYVVYSVHEYFVEADSHLHISQHQASLKQENFTVSYHSYTTLLPQKILHLQLHFSCTLCSINNLGLQKFGLVGMVSYHCMFLIFKCFQLYPNLNEVVSIGPNLICVVVICPNIYNICNLNETLPICPDCSNCTQVLMKLFQLTKYDQSCWNFEFAQMFPIFCKFKRNVCILPKLEWSCL